MSLLVRLPLNGNLNNYGSADVTVTVTGTTSYADGRAGKALSCNGSSYWTVTGVTLGSEASIACWSKTSTNGKMSWVLVATSSDKLNLYESSQYCLNTGDGNSNLFKDGSGNAINCLHDNQWHHFVVTFGNNIAKLYIDGAYRGTATTFKSPATTSAKTIKLAGGYSNGHSYDWNGLISDFRVYNHCLSESEIRHLIRGKGLQVWLPLTKDLRQQGLSNVTVTNNGATFNSAGKLGGCYSFNNSAIGIGATNITLGNTFSIACWIKVNSYNSDWANAFKIYKDGYDYIGLCMNRTSDSTKQLGFHIYKNNGSNARTGVYDGYYMPLTIGTWYHLCFVVTPSEVKTYQNGVNIRTGNITTTFPSVSNYNLSLGKSSSFGGLDCSMNDFRLYDHALSQKEVKELSKGLVLHYPLNRGGLGQENNIKTSIVQNRGCSNFIYNSSTNEWTMTCPTGSGTWGFGIVLNDRTIAWKSGESWLVSMEVYTPRAINWKTDINNKPDLADISSYTGNDYDDQRVVNTNGVQNSYQLQIGWNKLWFTQRAPSTYGLTNYSTNWGIITTNETSAIDIKIKNIKGEIIGSGLTLQPTQWCPNSSDTLATTMGLNSTTEYDCSGFCYNLNKNGTYSYTSDAPKYAVSTKFNGTEWMNGATPGAEILTLACWAKTSKNKSTSQFMVADSTSQLCISFYSGTIISFFGISGQSTGSKCTLGSAYKENDWNHFVVVKTGTGTRKVYCNGIEQTATSNDHWGSAAGLFIGSRNNSATLPFYGQICDIRAYATALSADDIAELYNGGVL